MREFQGSEKLGQLDRIGPIAQIPNGNISRKYIGCPKCVAPHIAIVDILVRSDPHILWIHGVIVEVVNDTTPRCSSKQVQISEAVNIECVRSAQIAILSPEILDNDRVPEVAEVNNDQPFGIVGIVMGYVSIILEGLHFPPCTLNTGYKPDLSGRCRIGNVNYRKSPSGAHKGILPAQLVSIAPKAAELRGCVAQPTNETEVLGTTFEVQENTQDADEYK